MRKTRNLFPALVAGVVAAALAAGASAETRKPNFLIILADDLGFSDLGAFGGEIVTPNLDRLAQEGVRLTGFHTAPTCSPTRAQLLTGTDNHLNGLGRMAEAPDPAQNGKPGYEGYLRADVATLPEILRDNGYRTVHSGKWHLGTAPEQDPARRGFDLSFTLAEAGHNHFGPGAGGIFASVHYTDNGVPVTALPEDFYSSDYFTDKLIDKLEDSRKAAPDKPFFAYLALTAPHWPLHAPEESIAKYRGKYDEGYEALRDQRTRRQAELGLVAADTARASNPKVRPWESLTLAEKRYYIAAQETYAGMVDRLDVNVGRVVEYLKRTGEYENTVILFLSDNGAEGVDLNVPPYSALAGKADNRPENIGSASSFAAIGPGWAEAATAPARLYKAYQSEGGTRVVAFVRGPVVADRGGISRAFGHVRDVTPTFLELAGAPVPQGEYNGRAIQPVSGRSLVAHLKGEAERVYPKDVPVGAELFGSRALRKGDWKLLAQHGGDWALYNLAQDPGETKDLRAQFPEKAAELIRDWEAYAEANNVILPERALYTP